MPAYKNAVTTRGSNLGGEKRLHTGYFLSRYGKPKTGKEEEKEDYDKEAPDTNVY